VSTTTDLDARYGRRPGDRRRRRVIAIVAAIATAVVVVCWVVWVGLFEPTARIQTQDVGYSQTFDGVQRDDLIEVRFQLSVDPGTETRCALQALDSRFDIVGWRVVDIPASDDRTRSFAEDVRTMRPSETGLIYSCWVA
jgi:hypothetical protein